ncbi:DUF1289 domain-containing protein [Methylomonas sp. MED-D]|uniref:DUF1289 domain-containing protein n=1 Tax=Methylomonas koyamae TaxID=702114 RepID=A0A177NTI2_9GAMM|nr:MULTISPECIES: DUF1289 domain-containing protein [Methylomonas]OAI21366.1 hypothetical protein A1355_02495 [Methylomonas koyamae]WGS86275.1 DUF1289 domain-containing protein [Methylomonas sp. UP202]
MSGLDRVASPCVRNCCLDDEDVCLGCFRSLSEICGWSVADDRERLSCLARAEQRKAAKKSPKAQAGAGEPTGGISP